MYFSNPNPSLYRWGDSEKVTCPRSHSLLIVELEPQSKFLNALFKALLPHHCLEVLVIYTNSQSVVSEQIYIL